jgi:hypothetical protein
MRSRWWISLSVPIALLATVASVAGIIHPDAYARESANWAGQAVGQDIANLIAYAALLVLAAMSARGSLRAYLAWLGVLGYSVYTYAIYAFALHFGGLFLAYVAVLGLSIYALIGALSAIDARQVRAAFGPRVARRSTALALIVIGSLFSTLWLAEIVPATLAGSVPPSLVQAGLASNPVYVLDLALLLPASILGGVLLLRGRPWGYVLAPLLLGILVLLSVGIVAAFAVLAARGEVVPVPVAFFVAVLAVIQLAVLVRFLGAVRAAPSAAVSGAVAA